MNVNDAYPPKNDVDKARVQRFFNLLQEFVDTFTDRWCILSIYQLNLTRSSYYHLCIICNGRLTELDLIGYLFALSADPPNFRMYEAMNYDDYDRISLAMFNITWDNFILFQHPQFALYQRELHQEELTDFHRSLQYMMLYHFIRSIQRGGDLYTCRDPTAPQPSWYDGEKHSIMNYNIFYHGRTMDTEMQVWEYDPPNSAGVRELVQRTLTSLVVLRGGRAPRKVKKSRKYSCARILWGRC